MSSNYRLFFFASGIIIINNHNNDKLYAQVCRVEVVRVNFFAKVIFCWILFAIFPIFQNKISLIASWRLICSNIKCQFKNQWLLFASQQAIWRTGLCPCSILIGANCQKCSASFVLFFTSTVCRKHTTESQLTCAAASTRISNNGSNSFFPLRCPRTSSLMPTDKLEREWESFVFFLFPSELWLSSFHCPFSLSPSFFLLLFFFLWLLWLPQVWVLLAVVLVCALCPHYLQFRQFSLCLILKYCYD